MKCCFCGQNRVIDYNISNLLDQKLKALVDSNEEIEFYFLQYSSEYLDYCIDSVDKLIKNHPTKSIKAVLCLFPNEVTKQKGSKLYLPFHHETVIIPEEYMPKLSAHWTINVEEKTRWLFNQCDQIITYYYSELYDGTNNQFRLLEQHWAQRQSIFSPETSDFLLDSFLQLSEREFGILSAVQQDLSLHEIGRIYNTSHSRARQIAITASRKLCHLALERYSEQKRKRKKSGRRSILQTT